MIKFDWVRVWPSYPLKYTVQWDVIGAGVPGTYNFDVYRSCAGGDWEKLGSSTTYTYEDYDSPTMSRSIQIYYKVVGLSPIGETFTSDKVILFEKPEKRIFLMAQEMVRREALQYEKYNGVRVAVLKRRETGEVCTTTTHSVLGESVCENPTGDGIGGYCDPVYTWARLHPHPRTRKQSIDMATNDITETQVTLSNYPLIKHKDVIVELHNNNRWNVKGVPQVTEMKRYPVQQTAILGLLERSSKIYDIEVDKDA